MDSMIPGVFYAHSGWRYLVILVMAAAIAKSLIGLVSGGRWGKFDQFLGFMTPMMLNIQFLLGLVLWILRARWLFPGQDIGAWEHPVTMIVTVAAAQITWGRVQRAETDADKFRIASLGFVIAGILLALGVARITHVL